MEPETKMNCFCQDLYQQLIRNLETVDESPDPDGTPPLYHKIKLIHDAINCLKERMLVTSFSQKEEEIYFMKKIFPDFLTLMIYYSEKADLEYTRPIASEKLRLELIDRKQNRIDLFFQENTEFVRYYHSGSSCFDEYYFLRSYPHKHRPPVLPIEWTTHDFCTVYSYKVATLLAYSKLEEEIQQMKINKSWFAVPSNDHAVKLEWTDSKSGLVELIYSLKEQGSFNNGKVDIKTITTQFAKFFSIELDNTSSAFQKILYRKTGRTSYIDQLKHKLLTRIEQIESEQLK